MVEKMTGANKELNQGLRRANPESFRMQIRRPNWLFKIKNDGFQYRI